MIPHMVHGLLDLVRVTSKSLPFHLECRIASSSLRYLLRATTCHRSKFSVAFFKVIFEVASPSAIQFVCPVRTSSGELFLLCTSVVH